jgi:hypothetical protein
MTLHVATARVSYGGPDRLDVTSRTASPLGRVFAPPWSLVWPLVQKRRRGLLTEADWAGYAEAYTALMRQSYLLRRGAWEELLARERVVLVCYCTDVAQCHRRLLGEILGKLGAQYQGEL